MENASEKNEDVEYRMVIFFVRAYLVEKDTDGVKYSAAEQKRKAVMTECTVHRADVENDCPTHSNVANHAEMLVFLEVYCVESDRKCRESPNYKEGSDSSCFICPHKTAQDHRCVSAGYEKIYRAMVKNLKYFFCGVSWKSVIYARDCVERYHRNAEDYAAYECERTAFVNRDRYAGEKRYNSPAAAYDMRDVIKYFLSFSVRGNSSFFQTSACHIIEPFFMWY